MSNISWLVPGRAISIVLPIVCDDNFVNDFDTRVLAILDAAAEPIHLFVDVREVRTYPSTQSMFHLTYLKHPKMGRLITIGATNNPIARFLARLFSGAMKVQLRDFSTMEEARAYLLSVEKF
jgi:hypothetical protein